MAEKCILQHEGERIFAKPIERAIKRVSSPSSKRRLRLLHGGGSAISLTGLATPIRH